MKKHLYFTVLALFWVCGAACGQEIVEEETPPVEFDCPCGIDNIFFVRGEALLWWVKGNQVPALVSTSPDGTPRNQAGVLGTPGATVLFGGNGIDDDLRAGGRVTLGWWADTCRPRGFVWNYWQLEDPATNFFAFSDGSRILSRPFFDTDSQVQDAELVAFPGVLSGAVSVISSSRLLGTELNYRENIFCGGLIRIDGLCGYRFAQLNEHLTILENLTAIDQGGIVPVGTNFIVNDSFRAANDFHGANFGLLIQTVNTGRLSLELGGKLAVGSNHREIDIQGFTQTTIPGSAPTITNGGLLAAPGNIVHSEGSKIAAIGEFTATARYALTEQINVLGGYTFFWWYRPARSGPQIDPAVSRSSIGTGTVTANPAFLDEITELWAQGLNFAIEFLY